MSKNTPNEQTFTVLDNYSICSVRKTQDSWAFNSVIANVLTEDAELQQVLITKITEELKYIGWSWISPELITIGTA